MATHIMDLEPWVDAETVGDFLKIGPKTVLAMARAGKLPATPLEPTAKRKDWRFKLSEVDAAMNGRVHSEHRPSPVKERKKKQ